MIKPCDEKCNACGSGDVYRVFLRNGTERRKSNGGGYGDPIPDGPHVERHTHYYYRVISDCIVHHCRMCSYEWTGDVLGERVVE